MIISKTPFRMSFVGGGSDLPSFFRYEIGAVLSTSIDKYMYIALNKKFDGRIRLSYSRTEEVDCVDQIQHPLVRECLRLTNIKDGIDISSLADIPSSGSGLGSSSSYTVGLLNALHAYKNSYISKEDLANKACEIEIDRCMDPIGKQDQYAAAFGGLNLIRFYPDNSVTVDPIICNPAIINELQDSLIIFFTGRTRKSKNILITQSKNLNFDSHRIITRRMAALAYDMKKGLEKNSLKSFPEMLKENWELKKELSDNISDEQIDSWYKSGLNAGALGGKLMGAGNGGFLLFFAPKDAHQRIIKSLPDLRHVEMKFDKAGAQIIYFHPT